MSQAEIANVAVGDIARFRRYAGGLVSVVYDSKTQLKPGNNVIGPIPEGYRPTHGLYLPCSEGDAAQHVRLHLAETQITAYNYSASAVGNVLAYAMYVTADPAPQKS